MSIPAGTRLGPYEVVDLVGAGGMGAVYRARDTRLGRDVALKVVRADGARGADRLRRFETEARAVARLSHPNVLSVFDVGTHEGQPYLVLELLEGETLRQRLCRGALPASEAADLARQACAGLQAAHARGIVHRDLKPENLFLTSAGLLKILDFGVAKLKSGDGAGATADTQTEDGLLLGTIGYLSPEQARGTEADARSDVFALGVVLYEALSGRRAFARESAADTLAAILGDDPPPLETGSGPLPVALEKIARRCLQKDPERRFQSAHDLGLALEAVTTERVAVVAAVEETVAPYPGLRSFTETEAPRFFGREHEVAALWTKLQRRRLLALIGPSGAGKTSFVRAGALPARPRGWAAIVSTPGTSPFLSLAQSLATELAGDAEAVRELLRFEEADQAVASVARWRRAHAGALVVVDQFEELFTQNAPEVQARFAALLGRLAAEADVRVLVSLRDDFLMRCHEHAALAPVFEELTPLGVLAGDALRRALVEPARAAGYRFEDEGLVERMLGAVRGERGALPLLAFAAWRLWELRDRERRLLTRESYEEIGGVSGALAQHAESVLERIGGERQGLVRELFRNLATSQGTRAVAEREELLSVFANRGAAEAVLSELIDARLLTSYEVPGQEGQAGVHRIELVHESLLAAWPRLVRWQAQDAEGALLRDQLKQAAHLWQEKGRPADLLWSGTPFREYALWRERYRGKLTAVEQAFARAMNDRALRRRRLRRAAVAAALVGLSAVAIVVSVSRQQAVASQRRGEASRLVALGRLELETDPTLTLAYVRKSLEVHDSSEARRLALEALWRGPVARVLPVPNESDGCVFVAPSPDGQWLACSNWGGIITLFSADGKTTRVLPNNRNAARGRGVLFSDDSRRLATFATGDPETVVWSVEGQEVARFQPGGHPRRFSGDELQLMLEPGPDRLEWQFVARRIGSPEARVLGVVAPGSGWPDLARAGIVHARGRGVFRRPFGSPVSTRADVKVGEHDFPAAGVNVHDGTGWIVSFDERREVRIWDGTTHRRLRTLQGLDPDRLFPAPLLDTRGTFLVWHSLRERAFPLWDLSGPPDADPVLLRKSEVTGDAGRGAFLPDGRWLATALASTGVASKVAFWPLRGPWPRVIRFGPTPKVVFTPDSRQLVSCGNVESRIYPVTPDAPAAHPVGWREFTCYGIAMDPSGRHALLSATAQALLLAPLDGGDPVPLVHVPPTESICAVALDAAGRWAATAACYAPEAKDRLLHVVDRRTSEARALPLPGADGEAAESSSVRGLRFVSGERLLSSSAAGLRRWDPATGRNEVLHPSPCGPMDASADGRRIVAGCKAEELAPSARAVVAKLPWPPFELLVVDTSTGERRTIGTHGTDIVSLALDPSGELLATGDSNGTVRVGRVDGSEPHLLVGASGVVRSLAFSPDGRWMASTAGNDIRLWPMPDLSQPPLHTLPHDVLLAKLDGLTNVRVVQDPVSSSGYRVDVGPFPGWKDVPSW